jgi:hypothetical protein
MNYSDKIIIFLIILIIITYFLIIYKEIIVNKILPKKQNKIMIKQELPNNLLSGTYGSGPIQRPQGIYYKKI